MTTQEELGNYTCALLKFDSQFGTQSNLIRDNMKTELVLHGLIEDMSNADYHAAPGVSKSQLDAVAISGLNYWDAYVNPDREPQEYKHCFAVGDGTHKLVLEPGTFEKSYAVGFDKSAHPDALDTVADMKKELSARNMMVSGAKPELAARLVDETDFPASRIMMMLERHHNTTMSGRVPIPARDYKNMMAMLKAVSNHHTAGGLLDGALVEQSYFVTDDNGILRKCRPDIITANGMVMPDLKTTDDVSEAAFGRTIAQRRYHVQAAWYLDIMEMLLGDEAPKTFCFIAAQKTRPYDVAVHWLTEDQIAIGRALYQRDLARLIECRNHDYWPGADNGRVIQAAMPNWAMNGDAAY